MPPRKNLVNDQLVPNNMIDGDPNYYIPHKGKTEIKYSVTGRPNSEENYQTYVAPPPLPKSYSTSGAGPQWWKPLTYSNPDQSTILAASANALMPTLAADDQTSIGSWLSKNFSEFSSYNSANYTDEATADRTARRNQMFAKTRAQSAMDNLNRMREATGVPEEQMGNGYHFLKSVVGLLDKYGTTGADGMNRATYENLMTEFDKISSGVDSNYVEIGKAFVNPTEGGSNLMGSYNVGGKKSYGTANSNLFV